MSPQTLRILGVVFPGFNIMDLTGPMEVFGNSQIPQNTRHTAIASATDLTKSSEGITIKRDLSFIELLATQSSGVTELETYDILVVPGAGMTYIQEALNNDLGLLRVLQAFAQLDAGASKWLFSACTGAAFLGAATLLHQRTVTTHWAHLDALKTVCAEAGSEVDVVRKRWVDAGKTDSGVAVVTAGGVSCGVDAALWIASQIYDVERALVIAKGMDYDWKYGKMEVTEGWVLPYRSTI